jgi:hypothetical protein
MHPDRFEALRRGLATAASRRTIMGLLGLGVAGSATAAGLDAALARNNRRKKRKARKSNNGAQTIEFDNLVGIPIRAREPGKNFKGTLDVLRFEEQNGAIVAIASLTGKVTGKGNGNRRIDRELTIPVSFASDEGGEAQAAGVQAAQATCEILNLVLGPIDLNLLGLRLQVNQIRIRLTAQQGGGLLGDLLCAIANLLSGAGALAQIVGALNQILGILRGV